MLLSNIVIRNIFSTYIYCVIEFIFSFKNGIFYPTCARNAWLGYLDNIIYIIIYNIIYIYITETENKHIILKPFRRKYYINIIIIQQKTNYY